MRAFSGASVVPQGLWEVCVPGLTTPSEPPELPTSPCLGPTWPQPHPAMPANCLAFQCSGLCSVLATALRFQCILSSVKIYIIVGVFCCCLFLYIAVTTLTSRNKDYIGTVWQWGLAGWQDHLCLGCAWKRPSRTRST